MNPVKLGIGILAIIIIGSLVLRLTSLLLAIAVPLGIIAGIGLIVYGLITGGKPLGGGRGRLP